MGVFGLPKGAEASLSGEEVKRLLREGGFSSHRWFGLMAKSHGRSMLRSR